MKHSRAAFCIMLVFAVLVSPVAVAEIIQPRNEIVIIVDASGSFSSRQAEAVERTVELLDGIAGQELRRWEENRDRVVIISLDALPEVVWSGSLRDLKAAETTSWAERFRARTDYANCTDVGAAFRLATNYLDGDPREVSRYLFAFSDMINEPPTTSIRQCRPAQIPSPPPEDFPWDVLRGVAVNIFWVPADQKLIWTRVAEQHGLKGAFAMFTSSESEVVPIMAPAPAQLATEIIEEHRQETTQRAKTFGKRIFTWAGWGVGFIFLLLALAILGAFLSSRIRSNRREVAVSRRVNRPVPPLNRAGHQRASFPSPGKGGQR